MSDECCKQQGKNLFGGLITAVRTLSVFPIPGRDANSMASALPWFPVVGAILGGSVYAVTYLVNRFLIPDWPEAVALITVAAGATITRGFHLDGLADWADSFGAMNNRKRMLEIMKDSRIGTFGVLALILVLLAKWIAVTRLIHHHACIGIVAAYILSRTSQVGLTTSLPYARPEGGTAEAFVSQAKPIHRWISLLTAAIFIWLLFNGSGLILLLVGEITRIAFGYHCRRRFGGVTGDLLGACSEIVETVVLFRLASQLPVGML